jgi:hypothetical protein
MINLTGAFSMIRLAAAPKLDETPDAGLRRSGVDAVIFVAQPVSDPATGAHLLLADPAKRLDKERVGILLIEQHEPAFLAVKPLPADSQLQSR